MLHSFFLLFRRLSLVFCLFIFGCDSSKKEKEFQDTQKKQRVQYTVNFMGDIPLSLKPILEEKSLLIQQNKRPPISIIALKHRIEEEEKNLERVLQEEGYFEGEIETSIDQKETPTRINIKVNHGSLYKIGKIDINFLSKRIDEKTKNTVREMLTIKVGENVRLDKIRKGISSILLYLKDMGYPFVIINMPEAVLDYEKKEVYLIFTIETDKKYPIKHTQIHGLENLSEEYVRNRLFWKNNDPYQERIVYKTQKKLIDTGLFSNVSIQPQKKNDQLIMDVHVKEAPPRLIGGGVRYATSEGIGLKFIWSHYNVLGGGESVGTEAKYGIRETQGKIFFEKPDFIHPEQKLRTEVKVTHEKNRAYSSRVIDISTTLKRPLGENSEAGIGVILEHNHLDKNKAITKNNLLGLPLIYDFDDRDSILDPVMGKHININIIPFFNGTTHDNFLFSKVSGSYYLPLWNPDNPENLYYNGLGIPEGKSILAFWGQIGKIFIQYFNDIPLNKRFYAGGAGSNRGYAYKFLGPLDSKQSPTGGSNLVEGSAEWRFRINESWGFVTFFDVASIDDRKKLDLDGKTIFASAGIGGRYFTGIGPIRFDIAFPFNKRKDAAGKNLDRSFQVYFSIGQAF